MRLVIRCPKWLTASAVRAWSYWGLPRRARYYIGAVIFADLAAIAVAASAVTLQAHDLYTLGLLLTCTAISVELTRKAGEKGGMNKDVHGVWELPLAILLPPLYALIAPVSRLALTQWRVRRAPPYRRVFTGASTGLSYGAASVLYHGVPGTHVIPAAGSFSRGLVWISLVAGCGIVQSLANKAMIMAAAKSADPATPVLANMFQREPLYNDVAELCIAVLVTYAVAGSPFLALAALPVVTLLQRSLRHAQLLNDSRADSKTGLLNSATWEHEASTEVSRAVRVKMPVAVALLDLDKFKSINDTYGHLTGDQVIKEVARTLETLLRDYDLAGRFGGEEFALLLPHTRSTDAFRIAERIRAAVAALRFIAPGASGGERLSVTVSIGVAALDGGDRREFKDLLAVADAALYRAKASGRDQVQMISTTRGLSAISGSGTARTASGAHPEAPSAFRRAASS